MNKSQIQVIPTSDLLGCMDGGQCAKEKQCEKREVVVGGYGTCDSTRDGEGKATAVLLPPSRPFLPLLLHSELTVSCDLPAAGITGECHCD